MIFNLTYGLFFQELWGPDYSSVYAATMSYNRFSFLLSHLRLDDAQVREEAKKHDKFAAARKVKKITFFFELQPFCLLITIILFGSEVPNSGIDIF
jgi:hypothetical protein